MKALPFRVDLTNRVAVVTGGGGVLGAAMGEALAQCGTKVAVLSRKLDNARQVANEIRAGGGTAEPWSCDVTDAEQLQKVRVEVEEKLGQTDILINAAGGNDPSGTVVDSFLVPETIGDTSPAEVPGASGPPMARHFFNLDPVEMHQLVQVNYVGTVMATHVFGRGMVERRRGSIVNISSMAAITPLTRIPTYSSAKAAVSNFTQWMAVHLARTGVRVNAIAPGFFITRQNLRNMLKPDGTPTPRGEKVLSQTPMNRFGEPYELLGALCWLVSDEAAGFVTGTIIPIDGGFHAYKV